MKKSESSRITAALLTSAILGIFCIVGIGFRLGFEGNAIFLISAWFNRIIMGLMIAFGGSIIILSNSTKLNVTLRGALFGLIVSFAWFLSTGFKDPMGFVAGIFYGIIIDHIATYFEVRK